ncbi:aminoglycoside phosphotransferase family protein [Shewanella sp. KX20019]|uniref:aminoglycoside phosphotransferase family protein n=1 Tax=Shewanella sp. KX20019 TaxID=2803864 RepID=UPI001928880E|nr:aminoglycoside phosphotransferase family protein [Shewanella sp. KX20019]
MNKSWIVLCDHEPVYVLKKYNGSRELADIKKEHSVLKMLSTCLDCKVPTPLENVITCDEANFGLFQFIDGEQPAETTEIIEKAARLIARVHGSIASSNLSLPYKAEPICKRVLESSIIIATLNKLGGIYAEEAFHEHVLFFYLKVKNTLHKLESILNYKHLIHGDFGITNLVKTQSGTLALIDWDEMRIDSPLMDIVSLCAFSELKPKKSIRNSVINCYLSELQRIEYKNYALIKEGLSNIDALIEVVHYIELSEMVRVEMLDVDYLIMLTGYEK